MDDDTAPEAVLVRWTTYSRDGHALSEGRRVAGRGCPRCALHVGGDAVGADVDDDDGAAHAPDCGLAAGGYVDLLAAGAIAGTGPG